MDKDQKNEILHSLLLQFLTICENNPYIKWMGISLIILSFVYSLGVVVDAAIYCYEFGFEVGGK